MPFYFSMPKLGMNMTEGVIVNWLVREGDRVESGQPIVEIETDKALNSVEAPTSGIVARIVKGEGETVPCTFVMAVITEPGEEIPAVIPEAIADGVRPKAEVEVTVGQKPASGGQEPGGQEPGAQAAGQVAPAQRINISPAAKALAKELGVDITKIIPEEDRISRKDVEMAYAAMQASAAAQLPAELEGPAEGSEAKIAGFKAVVKKPMSSIRRRIASRMSASARAVARVGLNLEVNATGLINWREALRNQGMAIGYSELWIKLAAQALQEHPYMNARLENEEIWEIQDINVGTAVDIEEGLVVPVIHAADKKGLAEISQELSEKIERARAGKSLLADFEAGTFTITSLGAFGIESFLPVINYSECAILAIGALMRKPVVENDQIQIQPRIALTLAFDHRIVDGAAASRFLGRVKELVEQAPTG